MRYHRWAPGDDQIALLIILGGVFVLAGSLAWLALTGPYLDASVAANGCPLLNFPGGAYDGGAQPSCYEVEAYLLILDFLRVAALTSMVVGIVATSWALVVPKRLRS